VAEYRQMRIQQRVQEAEGYLDLLSALGERWRPSIENRNRLAGRALDMLDQLEFRQPRAKLLARVNYLKGQALSVMERYAEAIQPLLESSRNDGDNMHVWLSLGWCYKRVGRLDLAIEALEEALAIDPEYAIIHYNLACYWSLARSPKLSVAYLASSFDIDDSYRDLVSAEPDFDAVRNHPDFLALTSVVV
jgi:tetratricopeptide (TPR) repeat protein